MFKNIKIGMRLGLGFGLVLILMIVLIFMGVQKMGEIQEKLDRIVKVNNTRVEFANQMLDEVHIISRVIRTIALLDDANKKMEENKKIDDSRVKYDESSKKLEELISTPEGKTMFAKINELKTKGRAANAKVLSLALANKKEEAVKQMLDEAGPIVKEWRQTLREFSKLQMERTASRYEEAKSAYANARVLMYIIGGVAILIGMIAAFWITRTIVGPITVAVGVANALSQGDLTIKVESKSKDEIGQMMAAIANMVDKLKQVVGDVMSAADNVASGSQEMSATAQQLAQGATEQAASAEEISSSMEEMSSSIKQNSDNSSQTEKIAVKSSVDAKEGGLAVTETVSAMKEIATKISIIEEIARQTNLLALNAAIEAARAGEHGKGFAVVASEVRKLAERSQAAAGEISTLSTRSVKIAETAGEMLNKMVPDIQKTAELVQEISAASREQDTGAEQISLAIQQLDSVIQQNASASDEMAATSEELSTQAEQLKNTISFFRLDAGLMRGSASGSSRTVQKKHVQVAHISHKAASPARKVAGGGLALDMGADHLDDEFEKF
ncbi:MAG: methyl-accepting chemotaxis protein [Pedobacter sp.]